MLCPHVSGPLSVLVSSLNKVLGGAGRKWGMVLIFVPDLVLGYSLITPILFVSACCARPGSVCAPNIVPMVSDISKFTGSSSRPVI